MSKQLNTVYIGVGTNVGNKFQNIWNAYASIQKNIGNIIRKSSIYKTPPWGFQAEEDFYNSVICVTTKMAPLELLSNLKNIESILGRKPKVGEQYESRIIDLDIIDFNNEVINLNDLQVPHKLLEERNFVAFPLYEIYPNWTNPVSHNLIKDVCHNLKNEISII